MMLSDSGILIVAALGYLVASVCYTAHVLLRHPGLSRGARVAAIVAVVAQTAAIGVHCATYHRTPFMTPADTISASAWAIALVYLGLDFLLRPQPVALGAVAQTIAFLCVFTGAVLRRPKAAPGPLTHAHQLDNGLISLHVIAILFAFSLLVLAFGCAILYLAQHRMLKKKRSGGLFGKLPPLTSIDRLAFSLVAFAFPLLTIGLISGAIRAAGGDFHGGWVVDPKVLLSIATWAVYGVYLGLHVLAHWRGPRANYILIAGLCMAFATYFAPTLVHRFQNY